MKNSIPVRNRASGRQSSCKLGIKDYSIHRNSPQRNAMLCVEFGWMLACMPVFEQVCDRYENWRPSRRKRWVGGGNGRCAHRRINDPGLGRGRVAFATSTYFFDDTRNAKYYYRLAEAFRGGDKQKLLENKTSSHPQDGPLVATGVDGLGSSPQPPS